MPLSLLLLHSPSSPPSSLFQTKKTVRFQLLFCYVAEVRFEAGMCLSLVPGVFVCPVMNRISRHCGSNNSIYLFLDFYGTFCSPQPPKVAPSLQIEIQKQ